MKIYYVANIRFPTEKAHGLHIAHMCESFARNNSVVKLIVPRRRNNISTDSYSFFSVDQLFSIVRLPTLDFVRFGRVGFLIQEWSFIASTVIYFLFKKDIDIIYIRGEHDFQFFRKFFKNKKIFLETHIKPIDLEKKQALYKKASGIITITQYYRNELINIGFNPEKVLWEPDAVDMRAFVPYSTKEALRKELGLPLGRFIVGYVGKITTMGKDKGVNDLIQSFPIVWKSNKNSFLMLVGAEPSEQVEVSKKLIELGLPADSFGIVNHVLYRQAARFMQAADVLIMNYPNSAHYAYYMSPLKLFEYMASGTPIISSDLPSIREILSSENAMLVPPGDQEALTEAIKNTIKDRTLVSKKAVQAFQDVAKYTWDKRAKRILDFIKKNYENMV